MTRIFAINKAAQFYLRKSNSQQLLFASRSWNEAVTPFARKATGVRNFELFPSASAIERLIFRQTL